MDAMPIYGKKSYKIFFPGTERPMTLKLGMDSKLTMTYFMARSNLVPYAFVWEKGKTMDFSETIVVSDLKLATDVVSDLKLATDDRIV